MAGVGAIVHRGRTAIGALIIVLLSCRPSDDTRDLYTAPRSTCRTASDKPNTPHLPCVVAKIVLEDVSFYVRGNWNPDTFVRFSPDGRFLAIGSYLSRLRMWDVLENKMRWEKEIPEGVVKRIDFSPDGKTVYFAEQSIDGFVYAADTLTGELKWRFRMADDLESGRPVSKEDPYGLYRLPGCYTLKTLVNGDVLVLGIHAWGDDPMMRDLKRLSRIYRFSPDGRLKWVYPESEPLPMTIIYMDADRKGESIVFLITKAGNQKVPFPFKEGSAVLLNGRNGKPLWHHTFTPLRPYFDEVGFWESISVSPDGARASVGLFDGRTALLDLDRHEIKQTFSFGTPILVSGVPVSASATYTHLASDHMAYFQTGQSSVPYASTMSSRVTAPPGPHPGARMLTAVDANGKTRWRYRSGHSFQNFWTDRSGRWLLTSVLRDDERLGYDSGAILFDTHRNGGGTAKLVYFYQVKGKTHYHADLAEGGSTFALVEVPYRDPKTDTLIGEYAVHIVR